MNNEKDHRLPGRRREGRTAAGPQAQADPAVAAPGTDGRPEAATTQAMPWRPGAFVAPPTQPATQPATQAPSQAPTQAPTQAPSQAPTQAPSQPSTGRRLPAGGVAPLPGATRPASRREAAGGTNRGDARTEAVPELAPDPAAGVPDRADPAALGELQAKLSKRTGHGRTARAFSRVRGLVRSDDLPAQLADAWQNSQTPLPVGRRVWLAGTHGGAGTTTLAVCLAHELQARRRDGAALVDAAPARVGLADRLPSVTGPVTGGEAAQRATDLLVFAPAPAEGEQATTLATALRRVAGVVLTDGGAALPGIQEQVEATVLVAEASVRGVRAVLRTAADNTGDRTPLVVFVQTSPATGLTVQEAVLIAQRAGLRAFPLRHDQHLAAAATIDPSRIAPPTCLDIARIAAATVQEVVTRP